MQHSRMAETLEPLGVVWERIGVCGAMRLLLPLHCVGYGSFLLRSHRSSSAAGRVNTLVTLHLKAGGTCVVRFVRRL